MSDGVNHKLRHVGKLSGDGYARAIAKVVVAQVCENKGFQAFQQSALETLSDVMVRYIHDIGRTALLYANLASRSQINHFDIIQGLEDLNSGQGFPGSSEIDHCLVNSGVIREILQYVSDYEEVPFVYDVPRFPVDRDRKRLQSFLQVGAEPPDEHIPEWLPAFPDLESCNVSLKESDGLPSSRVHQGKKMHFAQQSEKIQTQLPLSNTPYFLSSNGLGRPSSTDYRNLDKANEAVLLNPYLSAPVRVAEEEVSPGTTLTKKSSWDADCSNPPDVDRNGVASVTPEPTNVASYDEKLFSSQTAPVKFKIKIGKKTDVSSRIPSNWFVDESSELIGEGDANNDVKERAHNILKESMESAQDVGLV